MTFFFFKLLWTYKQNAVDSKSTLISQVFIAFMLSGEQTASSIAMIPWTHFFFFSILPETKTILNANDLNKISYVGSPLPVNYHTH